MKEASTKTECEEGCDGGFIPVTRPRAWKKQSRRKPALGSKLWLSRTTVQTLDADAEVASCALRLFRGHRGLTSPFFQRIRTALADYQKESSARCPSSSSSGPCTRRHGRGSVSRGSSGYANVYNAWSSQASADGRSQSVPPISNTGLDLHSFAVTPDASSHAGSARQVTSRTESISAPNGPDHDDSKACGKQAHFARMRNLQFQFTENAGLQVCQLAKSCRHTPKVEAQRGSSAGAWTMMKAVAERKEELRADSGDEKNDDDDNSERELTHFQAFDLAQQLCLPMGQVTDAWRQFKRYDSRNRGRLSLSEFQLLIRSTLRDRYPRACDIPRELLRRRPGDGKDVDIDFPEFLTWLSQHAFSEALLITPEKQLLRAKARELEVSIPLVENIRELFDEFDSDSDGVIEYREFCSLFSKLMACQSIPDSRILTFWMQIQGSSSGNCCFDVFLSWYLRFFDSTGGPLGPSLLEEDYYESVRPRPRLPSSNFQ